MEGQRYYSPEVGSWCSREPLQDYAYLILNGFSDIGKWHLEQMTGEHFRPYGFVENDPVRETDLLGLQLVRNCEQHDACVSRNVREFERCYAEEAEEAGVNKCLPKCDTQGAFNETFTGLVSALVRCKSQLSARNLLCPSCYLYNDGNEPMYFPVKRVPDESPHVPSTYELVCEWR